MSNSAEIPSSSAKVGAISRILRGIGEIVLIPHQKKQGRHLDPHAEDAPNISEWPEDRLKAWQSPEMETFRRCLSIPGFDVRDSILSDLSTYYGYSVEECYSRCIEWETWSVKEWSARERVSEDGLQDFYNTVQSWSFDLLWYSYLQAEGFGFPASVLAVQFAQAKCPGGRHLDFGSGVGVASQVFSRSGFTSTAADVSKPLLDFAFWRLERRGDHARRLDLTRETLETSAYDIATAVDTLVHVKNLTQTLADLHRAIRPGGWLLANFDVRDGDSVESASHLHNNIITLKYQMEAAGFHHVATLAQVTQVFQRVDRASYNFKVRLIGLRILLPFKQAALICGRIRMPTPRRVLRLLHLASSSRNRIDS
ncbi:MAG: class I SAM-dependent methyltransferase [Hyphomicrobium sp.]